MSAPLSQLYVASVGMVTSVGADAVMSAAAVRAGYSAQCHSAYCTPEFQSIVQTRVPEDMLSPLHGDLLAQGHTARQKRLIQLAAPALIEVLEKATLPLPPPLFLALPEQLPGCPATGRDLIPAIAKQAEIDVDLSMSRRVALGRAGGLQVIELAFKYLESTGGNAALVGGVDTHDDLMVLGRYAQEARLLARGVADGFATGEAAGFLLLMTHAGLEGSGLTPLCSLSRPGLASEPGHRYSEENYMGDGLAQAWRIALSTTQGQSIQTIYSSMNGEIYWAKEHGVAMIRSQASFDTQVKLQHPADCYGDIGAASASVMVGLVAVDKSQQACRRPALVSCSSDKEHRAAVIVH